MASLLAGFGFSLTLIVAIGAQNAFVLRQGLRREHVLAVVVTCAVSDALLISIGIAGLGVLVSGAPLALAVIRWAGAAFLLCYAVLAARRAFRPGGALAPADRPPATLGATLAACLAFTFLNPHVYLDTVVLLGAIAHQDPHRWLFGLGATTASLVWFTALGFGAHRLAPLLARPLAWRVVDGLIAAVMAALGLTLVIATPSFSG